MLLVQMLKYSCLQSFRQESKARNVMVSDQGRARAPDLGLVKLTQSFTGYSL